MKSPALWFPAYLLYLPGNVKSWWHSCDILKPRAVAKIPVSQPSLIALADNYSISYKSRWTRSWINVCVFLANNPDTVDKLEGLVALWSKVIEQVLAESEQVGH